MNTYGTGETIRRNDIVRIGKGKVDYSVTLPSDPAASDHVEIENLATGRHKVIPAARLTLVTAAPAACGAVYTKHTHPFTCTLPAGDHTEHADDVTDAPAVVHWATAPVAEDAPTDLADWERELLADTPAVPVVTDGPTLAELEAARHTAAVAVETAFAEFDAKYATVDSEADDVDERCPVCGEPSDYCQGHGEIGDGHGWWRAIAHDHGDHIQCHPAGCEAAGTTEHSEYPHRVGYLDSCAACVTGACVCSYSDSLAPCVSANCEASEMEGETDELVDLHGEHIATIDARTGDVVADEPRTYTGRDGHEYNATGPARGTRVGSIAERGKLGGFRGGLAVVVVGLLWMLAGLFVTVSNAPMVYASPVPIVTEDSPEWNCATMGDHECGQRPAVAPVVPAHCLALPGRPGNTRYVMVAPVPGLIVGCESGR